MEGTSVCIPHYVYVYMHVYVLKINFGCVYQCIQ